MRPAGGGRLAAGRWGPAYSQPAPAAGGVPGGAVGVEADAIREGAGQVGPDPTAGQAAIGGDVERGEPVGVAVGDDQGRVVRGDCDAVRELQPTRRDLGVPWPL